MKSADAHGQDLGVRGQGAAKVLRPATVVAERRTRMNNVARIIGLLVASLALAPSVESRAAGDLTKQDPVEIKVQLGNPADEQRFFPGTIELETGKLYRLVLTNPSPQKHYFSSDALAQSVFTRKVQVNDSQGNPIAEIKGGVREIGRASCRERVWIPV